MSPWPNCKVADVLRLGFNQFCFTYAETVIPLPKGFIHMNEL